MKFSSSQATDRIVVLAAGFGVWIDNRHIASGRWGDVVEVRIADQGQSPSNHVNLVVVLRDGTEVFIDNNLSGYHAFLGAAEAALPGLEHQSGSTDETIIFKRKGVRK